LDWLSGIGFAHWWVLAALLLVLELTTKVFFFLWLSFAAAAVGFLLLVFPSIPLLTQALLFGVLSLVAAVAWRRQAPHQQPDASAGAAPLQRDRVLALERPIVDGEGVVRIDGTTWRLAGPDLPAGARVRVVRVEGETAIVEPADGA
jgi:membrane protein implicated in regulation of membrane protease activity